MQSDDVQEVAGQPLREEETEPKRDRMLKKIYLMLFKIQEVVTRETPRRHESTYTLAGEARMHCLHHQTRLPLFGFGCVAVKEYET